LPSLSFARACLWRSKLLITVSGSFMLVPFRGLSVRGDKAGRTSRAVTVRGTGNTDSWSGQPVDRTARPAMM
jgi:hypothetical protein